MKKTPSRSMKKKKKIIAIFSFDDKVMIIYEKNCRWMQMKNVKAVANTVEFKKQVAICINAIQKGGCELINSQ